MNLFVLIVKYTVFLVFFALISFLYLLTGRTIEFFLILKVLAFLEVL